MDRPKDCAFRKMNQSDSDEAFMALLPGHLAQEMTACATILDEEMSTGDYEEKAEMLERPLCSEKGCPVSFVTLTHLTLALYARNEQAVQHLKIEALEGCDIREI